MDEPEDLPEPQGNLSVWYGIGPWREWDFGGAPPPILRKSSRRAQEKQATGGQSPTL